MQGHKHCFIENKGKQKVFLEESAKQKSEMDHYCSIGSSSNFHVLNKASISNLWLSDALTRTHSHLCMCAHTQTHQIHGKKNKIGPFFFVAHQTQLQPAGDTHIFMLTYFLYKCFEVEHRGVTFLCRSLKGKEML